MRKLSNRQIVLLILINDYSLWKGDERPGKEIAAYWVPNRKPQWSATLKQFIDVSGAGDANALLALERKNLIKRVTRYSDKAYTFIITEDGIATVAKEWTV